MTNEQSLVEAHGEITLLKEDYIKQLTLILSKKSSGSHIDISMLLDVQKKANNYFNYVENFVANSELLGAHNSGLWVTGLAEDCYTILESLVIHYVFLRSYANDFGQAKDLIEPPITAFANMQRMVVDYLPTEKSSQLKEKFSKNNLPITGFCMPAAENKSAIPRWQIITGVTIGLLLLLMCIGISLKYSSPTQWQQLIVRGAFAISLALLTPIIPGFINLTSKFKAKYAYFKIVAGGSLAVFVLIWLVNPPEVGNKTNNTPSVLNGNVK